MFGGKGHECHAEDGIRARGEDGDTVFTVFQGETNFRPHRFADPVALHADDSVGPSSLQLGEIGQKLIGVCRDLQEPLGQFLLFHGRIAPPAQPVDHLFVGKHRIAVRAPVLSRFLAVYESLFQPAEKEKLFPAIVGRITGGDFSTPVVRIARRFS